MPYRYEHATDGIDETYDIITPAGERSVSVHFWSDPERAEAKAKLITDALNSQPTVAEPHAFFAEHQQIAIVWSVEDVQEVRPSLDRDQAWEVLKAAEHHHDCNYGLTWDNLKAEADHLFPQNAA